MKNESNALQDNKNNLLAVHMLYYNRGQTS